MSKEYCNCIDIYNSLNFCIQNVLITFNAMNLEAAVGQEIAKLGQCFSNYLR